MSSSIALIYTTCDNKQTAETLAEEAVSKRLAACVNILPEACAVYQWQGKLEKHAEYCLLFKTDVASVERLQTWLEKAHPYQVPAILTSQISASWSFAAYVQSQTKPNKCDHDDK